MRRFLFALCSLSLFAIPATANAIEAQVWDNSPPQSGFIGTSPGTVYVFDSVLNAWCLKYGLEPRAWGGCVPEYTIPPDKLRTLREKAGLDPKAPVYTPPSK